MIRRAKGAAMFLLFAAFALGIGLELLLFLPVVALWNALRGPDPRRMAAVHRVLMGGWLVLLRAAGLLRAERTGPLPAGGPYVVVANHPGLFDVVVLIRDLPGLSVLVKRSLAQKLPLGPVLRASGYVLAPDLSNAGTALQSLREATAQLAQGRSFLLFPEGTRSPRGGLRPFRAGAFKIARLAGVPVLPLVIHNTPPFLPHEDRWYLPPRRCSTFRVEFLEPVPPPAAGEEAAAARALEARYRVVLGLGPATPDLLGSRAQPALG